MEIQIGKGQGITQAIKAQLESSGQSIRKDINVSIWGDVMSQLQAAQTKGAKIFKGNDNIEDAKAGRNNNSNFVVQQGKVNIDDSVWSKIVNLLTGQADREELSKIAENAKHPEKVPGLEVQPTQNQAAAEQPKPAEKRSPLDIVKDYVADHPEMSAPFQERKEAEQRQLQEYSADFQTKIGDGVPKNPNDNEYFLADEQPKPAEKRSPLDIVNGYVADHPEILAPFQDMKAEENVKLQSWFGADFYAKLDAKDAQKADQGQLQPDVAQAKPETMFDELTNNRMANRDKKDPPNGEILHDA